MVWQQIGYSSKISIINLIIDISQMNSVYPKKPTVKLHDEPGSRVRISSMIEVQNRSNCPFGMKKGQTNDKINCENYEDLIKQKTHYGFSQEVEFMNKNFACLHKVLKIYQKTLTAKQQVYKELLQKNHQLNNFNQKLDSQCKQTKMNTQKIIAEQSRVKSKINQVRMNNLKNYHGNQKETASENSDGEFGPTFACEKISELQNSKKFRSYDELMQQFKSKSQNNLDINNIQALDLREIKLQSIQYSSKTSIAAPQNKQKIKQQPHISHPSLHKPHPQSDRDRQNSLFNIRSPLKSKPPANHQLKNNNELKMLPISGNLQSYYVSSAPIPRNPEPMQIPGSMSQRPNEAHSSAEYEEDKQKH